MNLWQPLSEKFIANPYENYELIRQSSPVYQTQTNEFIITDYALISQVLKDKVNYRVGNGKEWLSRSIGYLRSKDKDFTAITEAIQSFILLINPPQHHELRKFVMDAWDEKEVDDMINKNCQELIATINKQEFDFISAFASRLPVMTICGILGIDYQKYKELQHHGSQMIRALDFYLKMEDLVKIDLSAKQFIKSFDVLIKKPPSTGLIRRLIELNKLRATPFNHDELISICIFLFVAGEETTTSFLSSAVMNLLKTGRWNDIHDYEINDVTNELLRYDGPVHLLGRITNSKVELGEKTIPKESSIIVCLAAANRDMKIFDHPESIRYDRSEKHLAFGSGIHFCLGDWLAKRQASIALKSLHNAYPNLKLRQKSIKWKKQLAIRRLEDLYVQV